MGLSLFLGVIQHQLHGNAPGIESGIGVHPRVARSVSIQGALPVYSHQEEIIKMITAKIRRAPAIRAALAICAALALALALAGCGASPGDAHPIVGTWFYGGDPPATYTFRANGTVTMQTNGSSFDGTWSASGNQLTLAFQGNSETHQFHISGNTLYIYFDGEGLVPFTRQ